MFCRPFHRALGLCLMAAGTITPSFAEGLEAPGKNPPPYRVRRWMTEQGLPQNRISSLQQTRDGYLWIGTWFGVARFDGVRFTVFDKFNTPELLDDTINALAEDMVMDRTTLGRNIQPLERDGLIRIEPAPSDRRAKVLHLTKSGEKRLQAGLETWSKAQARFEAGFGSKRAAELRTLLRAVVASQFTSPSQDARQ